MRADMFPHTTPLRGVDSHDRRREIGLPLRAQIARSGVILRARVSAAARAHNGSYALLVSPRRGDGQAATTRSTTAFATNAMTPITRLRMMCAQVPPAPLYLTKFPQVLSEP
jgi:hypothetical protein